MKKQRVEAITDGIIAIAATIMVLELKIPSKNDLAGLSELGHTFLAYVVSFLLIYLAWSLHHDLFKKAELITKQAFMVNGIWILFLTLVPFTTAWVGSAPDATLPEFLYPLNMLLWSLSFQWLEYRIQKDNPGVEWGRISNRTDSIITYSVFVVCMVLAFFIPQASMYIIALSALFRVILALIKKKKK